MAAEARAVVARAAPGAPLDERRVGFARYVGQGHEIAVDVTSSAFAPDDDANLRRAFEAAYRTHYGRLIDGVEVEFLSWTVTVSTRPALPTPVDAAARRTKPAPAACRDVVDAATGTRYPTPIHWRAALTAGSAVAGPAGIGEGATPTR